MFNYSDRIPTGAAVPSGRPTPVPWGLSRMIPYPEWDGHRYTSVTLDSESQTAVYYDEHGAILEMPKHGTSTGTNPPTATAPPGDSNGPSSDTDTGNDNDQ